MTNPPARALIALAAAAVVLLGAAGAAAADAPDTEGYAPGPMCCSG